MFLANKKFALTLYSTLIRNLGGTKIPLILYCWLFYDLTTMFFTNLQFVYWRTPSPYIPHFFAIWLPCFLRIYNLFTEETLHPLLGIFLRFDHRLFWQLTISLHPHTQSTKWQLKKGMTIPLKNQCMSCPISMVSVLTLAGGYKLFSGLLYWSVISVSGGWMLCTIHKLFNCLLSFLDSIISNVCRELCWSM